MLRMKRGIQDVDPSEDTEGPEVERHQARSRVQDLKLDTEDESNYHSFSNYFKINDVSQLQRNILGNKCKQPFAKAWSHHSTMLLAWWPSCGTS
jgi:hypothetical protein